ncbi:hypothetical protein PMAYCL1PPCAC_18556, partial [Pristionchus mayeri]
RMNHDCLILPRHAVVVDKARELIISGAGPIVQVFALESDPSTPPISTIHVFDRQNVNVEYIKAIGTTGHYCVVGNKFLSVIHADENVGGFMWINHNRIHEIQSEIVKVFDIFNVNSAENLIFSLFILHQNRHLSRHVVHFKQDFSIDSATIESKIFDGRLQYLMDLSPSSFFGHYTDTSLSFPRSGQLAKYQRIGFEAPATATIVSTSMDGQFIFSATSLGAADMIIVDDNSAHNTLNVIDEANIGARMEIHRAKPMCIIVATLAMDINGNQIRHSSRHDQSIIVIIGFEDGYIAFYDVSHSQLHLHGQAIEITKLNLESDAILSLYAHGSDVFYSTRSGCLGSISIPLFRHSTPTYRNFSQRGLVNSKDGKEIRVYSCSYHLFTEPHTALLVMADEIRLFLFSGSRSIERTKVKTMKRGIFKSGSITIFPSDLYTSSSPRLVLALSSQFAVFLLTVPTDDDLDSFDKRMDEVNVSRWGIQEIEAVSLPPISFGASTIKAKSRSRVNSNTLRMAVLTKEKHLLLLALELSPSGRYKRSVRLCQFTDLNQVSRIGSRGSILLTYNSFHLGMELEWIGEDGVYQYVACDTENSHNTQDLDIMAFAEKAAEKKGFYWDVKSSGKDELAGVATVCTIFSDEMKKKSLKRTVIGTKNGIILVRDLVDKVICNLRIGDSEISAISASQGMIWKGSQPFGTFCLLCSVSTNKTVSLIVYYQKKLSLVSQQKCGVNDARGVYCIEERKRKSLRVVVVGRHMQTLFFCLKPLAAILEIERTEALLITANRIPSELRHIPNNQTLEDLFQKVKV